VCWTVESTLTSRQLPHTTSHLNSMIRKLLAGASKDTLAICTSRPASAVLAEFQIVQQSDEDSLPRTPDSIVSSVAAKCIAFVDREADIRLAARCIFQARFMLGGKSSYAPDIVFVHEAAVKLFQGHIAHLWTHLQSKGNGSISRQPANGHTAPKVSQCLHTLHEGGCGLIVEATDRYRP
jgi:hypothetical protein